LFFYIQINPVLTGKKKKKKKVDEIEENFYDIVDMDEGHAQEFIKDKFITKFLESTGFQTFMMGVIFLNAIELALRTSDELVRLLVAYEFHVNDHAALLCWSACLHFHKVCRWWGKNGRSFKTL